MELDGICKANMRDEGHHRPREQYISDWKLNPNVECQVVLKKLRIGISGQPLYRNAEQAPPIEESASTNQSSKHTTRKSVPPPSCAPYKLTKYLITELYDVFEQCEVKCELCDKYIRLLYRHFYLTHCSNYEQSENADSELPVRSGTVESPMTLVEPSLVAPSAPKQPLSNTLISTSTTMQPTCSTMLSPSTTIPLSPTMLMPITNMLPSATTLIPTTTMLPSATMFLPPSTTMLAPMTNMLPPSATILHPSITMLMPSTTLLPPPAIMLQPITNVLPPSTTIIQPYTTTPPPISYKLQSNTTKMPQPTTTLPPTQSTPDHMNFFDTIERNMKLEPDEDETEFHEDPLQLDDIKEEINDNIANPAREESPYEPSSLGFNPRSLLNYANLTQLLQKETLCNGNGSRSRSEYRNDEVVQIHSQSKSTTTTIDDAPWIPLTVPNYSQRNKRKARSDPAIVISECDSVIPQGIPFFPAQSILNRNSDIVSGEKSLVNGINESSNPSINNQTGQTLSLQERVDRILAAYNAENRKKKGHRVSEESNYIRTVQQGSRKKFQRVSDPDYIPTVERRPHKEFQLVSDPHNILTVQQARLQKFPCFQCGRVFARKISLLVHEKFHIRADPAYRPRIRGSLRQHTTSHGQRQQDTN